MLLTQTPPMPHHSRLGKCKRHKNTDRIQVEQRRRIAFENYEQETCENCQHDNTYREGKAITTKGKLVRQKMIAGQQRRQAREVRIARSEEHTSELQSLTN